MNLRLYETRRGLMFHLENDNCIGLSLAKYGEWAEHELSLMKRFINPGDVVLDVGANIGTHSLAFQQWVGAKGFVFAFEPQKKIFQILCANLAINNCPSTMPINALIGTENQIRFIWEEYDEEKTNFGSVSFYDVNSRNVNKLAKKQKSALATIQLDSFSFEQCDFMKIDVEGMELDVLQSSQKIIESYHPIIFFEQASSRNFFEIIKFLKNYNYRLYWQVTYPFNRGNFRGSADNIFGAATETYILGLPEKIDIESFPELAELEIRSYAYDPPALADAKLGCYISSTNSRLTSHFTSGFRLEKSSQYSDNGQNMAIEEHQKTQKVVEEQAKEINRLKSSFNNLLEDRKKAQQIMEYQAQKIQELTTLQISITDDWAEADMLPHRDRLAEKHLKGSGIEIGALHKPTKVSSSTQVKYVDYKTKEQNLVQYPELKNENIVETDIVDEAFVLSKVEPESQDFLIANHVLEHSPNPIGTLNRWLSKLRPGGCLFLSVPIADRCFDKGRPITSLDHLIEDYKLFSELRVDEIINVTRAHLKEFMEISGVNIRRQANLPPSTPEEQKDFLERIMLNLTKEVSGNATSEGIIEAHVKWVNLKYDVHYHTFSPTSFLNFCKYFTEEKKCVVEEIVKSGGGEAIAVLAKMPK